MFSSRPTSAAGSIASGSTPAAITIEPGCSTGSTVPATARGAVRNGLAKRSLFATCTPTSRPSGSSSRLVTPASETWGTTARTSGRAAQLARSSGVSGRSRWGRPNWVKKSASSWPSPGCTNTFSRPRAANCVRIASCTPTPSETIVTIVKIPTITPVEVRMVRTLRRLRFSRADMSKSDTRMAFSSILNLPSGMFQNQLDTLVRGVKGKAPHTSRRTVKLI